MKTKIYLLSIILFFAGFAQAQTTRTVGGAGADYSTLKLAFDAINAGTIKGQIILKIIDNTTETATATLNASGAGSASYSSVNIYPTVSGKAITGDLTLPIIYFLGADNVTIDGRLNAEGSTKDLTITNNSIATGAVIVRYVNSAESNTIRYCTLKASPNSVGTGILYFTNSDSGNGNNNNIVEYCDITCNSSGRPRNAVFTSGTSGRENRYNIIRNNNFHNVFHPSAYSYTINISNSSSDWTISNNSFYETSTLIPTDDNKYYYVYLNTGNNHIVDNNYFGGTQPECAGSALTINSSFTHYYAAIFVNGGSINKSIISNNIIRNMNYTSTNSNPWDGIYINSGNVDVTGNTIGAETGTGSIIITTPVASATATVSGGVVTVINLVGGGSGYTVAPTITFSTAGSTTPATATANLTGGVVTSITLNSGGAGYTGVPIVSFDGASYSTSHGMIQNSSGIVNISNNKTGSITTVGSATYSHGFESIYLRTLTTTAITNITNNLYGSLTTPNSIYTSSTAANSPQKQDVYGIYSSSVGTTIITGNTIANLTNGDQGTNSGSKARGIQTISGSNIVQNNTVRNLSALSGSNGKKVSASVIGISQSSSTAGTTQIVSNNTVSAISNTNLIARTSAIGIYYSGPTTGSNVVNGNFIYNVNALSTDIGSEINGLVLFNGMVTASNNIINIGGGIASGYLINGIWDEGNATSNNSIYFNTVYVAGTVGSGATSNTAAMWNNFNGATRNYRNNLFVNNRSAGSSGKHFSIFLAGTANTTIDYNDYYCPNGVLGKISSNERSTLALWKAATGQDVNSVNVSPGFTNAGGNTIEDYYISATLAAVSGTGITTDYSNITRNTTPKMGALETSNYTWQGSVSTDFANAGNWTGGVVPTDGADITMAATPNNDCVLDQNRTVKSIINAQSAKKFVLNGKKLTLTGNLNFLGGAQIDGTASDSHIDFNGTAAQNIPTGSFVNSKIDYLSITNANGFSLNGNFTIEKGIALNAGNFNIGANTLTFNGEVTAMNGSVTGGTSTNMIIGGTGSTISMPEFTLNNLTINRSSGVNLYGNLNIVGTLTLTSGTMTVGANTLTIATNAPVVSSGNIDARHANASVVFTNTVAITLPASLFVSNTLNNLTVNSTGGISSAGDLTVNGILNLQSDNESATKGSLDMWDGSAMKTLTMGADATTVGIGDVTGIIRRTSFLPNVVYSFGNPYTTVTFPNTGIMPTNWEFKVKIGTAPSWKSTAIKRTYDIIRTGGTGSMPTVKLHYKDAELNSNSESHLVFFGYLYSNTSVNEFGRINSDETNNWVSLSGSIEFAPETYGVREWTLSSQEAANFTWLGTVPGYETDWNQNMNWVGGVVPTTTSNVLIPTGCAFYPTVPTSISINSISIENGAVVNATSTTTITINGASSAWFNRGTFNPGTSNVMFTNAAATMTGETDFYDLTINNGAGLKLTTNCHINIGGSITNNGIIDATEFPNTVDFSGSSQTIINPNGATAGYYNLLLSGSGTKTMPPTDLNILNDFTITGTASATSASAMTVAGDVNITENASWNTDDFNHILRGDFFNFGTFTAASGMSITFEGVDNQINSGGNATNFTNLILNNEEHLSLFNNININEQLTLTAGNIIVNEHTLGINGTITRSAGHIEVSPLSSLSFGGTDAIVLNDNLFTNTPTINSLTINRSGGVTLGNQSITVNGLLNLQSGTLSLAANNLTIAGSSPTRTSGNIDASNPSSALSFTNSDAIILPASIFTGNVINLTINGAGGVTASSDFTISGNLHLQSENPSTTKGSLDMWDGSATKTLTMGVSATTIGPGDVTGIIGRTSFVANTPYTFGNQFTTISFLTGGTYPSEIKAKISIGASPSWKTAAINRLYDFIQTEGVNCLATITTHYLDSELNGNSESELVQWTNGTNGQEPTGAYEWGHSAYNSADNWVSIANVNIGYFPTAFGNLENTLSISELSSCTWNGSTSGEWTTLENWTPTGTPSTNSNVVIPDATTTANSPILSGTTEIKNLTIETAAQLNIAGSGKLTVSNYLINNAGTAGLVIQSTANDATGSLINSSPGVSATVERWMTGDLWHLISPAATGEESVSSVASFANDVTNSIAYRNNSRYGLAPYNESNNTWLYYAHPTPEGYFDKPGKGYQVMRVLRENGDGTGNGTVGGDGIVSFKGTLAAGDKTIAISRTTSFGWNLIGNPYPCALDVKKFLNADGDIATYDQDIDPSFYAIYVANIGDTKDYGYEAVNLSTTPTLELASGEGFFVKSKTDGGIINFTASTMKSHTSDAFKSAVIQNGFNLVAESAGNKMSTTVKYIPQMTAGLDPGWDAGLFDNGDETSFNLFTELVEDNGVDFTIQCLPDYDYENLVVPVGIIAKQGARVSFSLADVTIPVGYKVFLEDRVNRKFTRLDEQGSIYSVKLNTAGNGTGQFFLHTKQEITGIKDGLSNHIVVIPLPQHSIIRVSGLVNLPAQATVYDMNGRTIAIKNLTGLNENEIPLQGVSNGIYLIKIKSDKETTLSKFSWSL